MNLPPWLAPAEASLAQYADLLGTTGVTAGLIGPREVPRLWTRHLLNCAVVVDPSSDLVAPGSAVVDVGSGAGLPGLVWAVVRPDLRVTLLEPLLRRATFLAETVEALGVADRVTVHRGRAEDLGPGWPGCDVVTARAVAPLDRLLGWTVPLLKPGGYLVALKGANAEQEVASAAPTAASLGMVDMRVVTCGIGQVDPPTTVVVGRRQ